MKKFVLFFGFLLVALGILLIVLDPPYRYLLESNANLQGGKVARAVNVLKDGFKKYPENYEISYALARAYLLVGEIQEANKIIRAKEIPKAFKADNDFQDFLVDLSESNYRLGNEKSAREFAFKYLDYQFEDEVSKRIIKNYMRIGRIIPEKSVELWEKAYSIASKLKQVELKESLKALLVQKYFRMAEDLRVEKKYEASLEILQRAKLLGSSARLSYLKAIVYGNLEKLDLACEHFEQALQLAPQDNNYKIAYAKVLERAIFKTKDKTRKEEYIEKIKLLLSSSEDDPRKVSILNKIVNLNAKYKVTNADLKITMVGDYLYPSLSFKITPVSNTVIEKYKIVFYDESENQIDTYEAPVVDVDLNEFIEVTCKNPINDGNLINAKLFLNDEFVKQYRKRIE